jgi:ferritin
MDQYSPQDQIQTVSSIADMVINQMNQEIVNSRFYKNFAGICDANSYLGAKKYFETQSKDEQEHHEKLYEYICSKGWNPVLKTLAEVEYDASWSLLEMFAQAHQLEIENLKLISDIKKKSFEECDFETFDYLAWFVMNQTSEIDEMLKWKRKLVDASDSPAAILMIDEMLGEV